MSERPSNPLATRRRVPDDVFGGRLADCFLLDLEVAAITDTSPRMRTITFRSTDLIGFEWQGGQDVMFSVPGTDPPARRRYTIRRTDPDLGTLDIDVVLHGDGPFARWAAAVEVGDRIDGIGPRGVILVRAEAAHHLFVGDESAMAVCDAMAESLVEGTSSTVIVGGDTSAIVEAVRVTPLPDGTVAYVNGERSLVRDVNEVLVARGLDRSAIVGKPYWRADQPNAAHGEPAKD